MRTIVFQSYTPGPIPVWIKTCLDTVEAWSILKGHTYRFLNDELFDPVPSDFRERCGREILPVTDVARAMWMRRLHAEGFERVIWMDADVLVFDPAGFEVGGDDDYALAREIWVEPSRTGGRTAVHRKVNNCVAYVDAGSTFLDTYLAEVLEKPRLGALDAGTSVFTAWEARGKVPLIEGVCTVNHALIHDLVRGQQSFIRIHDAALGHRTHAAHFVHSYSRPRSGLFFLAERNFEKAVERVSATGGAVLNPRG